MSVPPRERKWWTKSEDEILQREARLQIEKHGSVINWSDVAAQLPDRSNKDCRKRWCKVRHDIRRGAWMPEEDERLQKAVAEAGLKWTAVSHIMQTRNADQCAKRWQHVLGPDVKHSSWTPEEDRILLAAIEKYGNNWKQVGISELPGRSAHDIRNRSVALSRRNKRSRVMPQQSRQLSPVSPAPASSQGTGDSSDDDTDAASDPPSYTHDIDMGFYADNDTVGDWALPDLPDILTTPMSDGFSPSWEMDMLNANDPLQGLSTDHAPSVSHWDPTSTSDLQMLNVGVPTTNALDQVCLDTNLDDYTFGIVNNAERAAHSTHCDINSLSTNSPTNRTPSNGSSSVTVVLKLADSELTQKVVGNLMQLNANLTIHVLKD